MKQVSPKVFWNQPIVIRKYDYPKLCSKPVQKILNKEEIWIVAFWVFLEWLWDEYTIGPLGTDCWTDSGHFDTPISSCAILAHKYKL